MMEQRHGQQHDKDTMATTTATTRTTPTNRLALHPQNHPPGPQEEHSRTTIATTTTNVVGPSLSSNRTHSWNVQAAEWTPGSTFAYASTSNSKRNEKIEDNHDDDDDDGDDGKNHRESQTKATTTTTTKRKNTKKTLASVTPEPPAIVGTATTSVAPDDLSTPAEAISPPSAPIKTWATMTTTATTTSSMKESPTTPVAMANPAARATKNPPETTTTTTTTTTFATRLRTSTDMPSEATAVDRNKRTTMTTTTTEESPSAPQAVTRTRTTTTTSTATASTTTTTTATATMGGMGAWQKRLVPVDGKPVVERATLQHSENQRSDSRSRRRQEHQQKIQSTSNSYTSRGDNMSNSRHAPSPQRRNESRGRGRPSERTTNTKAPRAKSQQGGETKRPRSVSSSASKRDKGTDATPRVLLHKKEEDSTMSAPDTSNKKTKNKKKKKEKTAEKELAAAKPEKHSHVEDEAAKDATKQAKKKKKSKTSTRPSPSVLNFGDLLGAAATVPTTMPSPASTPLPVSTPPSPSMTAAFPPLVAAAAAPTRPSTNPWGMPPAAGKKMTTESTTHNKTETDSSTIAPKKKAPKVPTKPERGWEKVAPAATGKDASGGKKKGFPETKPKTLTAPKSANANNSNNNNKKNNSRKPLHPRLAGPGTLEEEKVQHVCNESQMDAMIHFKDGAALSSSSSSDKKKMAGKQKLGPRKKKLTTLKKRILQERLAAWRKRQEEEEADGRELRADGDKDEEKKEEAVPDQKHRTVQLVNYIQDDDDLDDEEEHAEIVSDLQELAQRIGPVEDVSIQVVACPNKEEEEDEDRLARVGEDESVALVRFVRRSDAQAAEACWNGMVIGGQSIQVSLLRGGRKPQALQETSQAPKKEDDDDANVLSETKQRQTVLLEGILNEDDVSDEDCIAECLEDLRAMATQYGAVDHLSMELSADGKGGHVYVTYSSSHMDPATGWQGQILGGQAIVARRVATTEELANSTVVLHNVLTEDDAQDEECLEESKQDILELARGQGEVLRLHVMLKENEEEEEEEEDTHGKVFVQYDSVASANAAVCELNGTVLGGEPIGASLALPADIDGVRRHLVQDPPKQESSPAVVVVVVENALTEDDLEDEECLEESKNDLLAMAQTYGSVNTLKVVERSVHLEYELESEAEAAVQALNGSMLGGEVLHVFIQNPTAKDDEEEEEDDEEEEEPGPPPMYSGDKLIPERYAECKRVPKIPNQTATRTYAKRIVMPPGTANADAAAADAAPTAPALIEEMLSELMRLQKRAVESDSKNARARRRLVLGLREVARGIRASKVKLVVMADNLDEYGAVDGKLQEILQLAAEKEVPVLFELSKRKLGRAVGKSIKVSVVGVQNADGAHEAFKKLCKMYQRQL